MGTSVSKSERYWNLVRLGEGGDRRTEVLPQVKLWFEAHVPGGLDDGEIQKRLFASQEKQAQLALRCFVSHQIEQVCQQLAMQFGGSHGFGRRELLAYVLDDDGRDRTSYQPLSVKILESFDPSRASLSTWAMRLVKHHRELNQFLVECGVYLLSDWAILNDTNGPKLRRILTEYQPTARTEIERAAALLDAYHEVYRGDRSWPVSLGSGVPVQRPHRSNWNGWRRSWAFRPRVYSTNCDDWRMACGSIGWPLGAGSLRRCRWMRRMRMSSPWAIAWHLLLSRRRSPRWGRFCPPIDRSLAKLWPVGLSRWWEPGGVSSSRRRMGISWWG
ncbi:MAG: hypothetical protein HC860_08290 [Alkalinema sp. RU_4_3]|nr:hypothetical protein [Alkalinema sp. RU_4_3]